VNPRPVKTVRRVSFLVRHWKLLLVLAVLVSPLVGYSYYSCSQEPAGCSVYSVVVGVFKLVAKLFS
jgi:hypothetical protein